MTKNIRNFDLDEMIVFERPILICGDMIYGFIKSSKIKSDRGIITNYIGYLVGAERFEQQNGKINDDGTLWIYPDEIHTILANNALKLFTAFLFQGTVGYKVYKFDQPICWLEGEVDNYDGTPCFIYKKELIERYTTNDIKK